MQGFDFGIRLWRATDGRLRDLILANNRFGISLTDSDHNVVEGGSGSGNAVAIQMSGSHGNRIERNVLTSDGIVLTSSNDNRVVDNILGGMQINSGSANDLVAQNSVSRSWAAGIYVAGSGHRIEHNTITGTGLTGEGRGIYLDGARNTRVVRNAVSNHGTGIYCINAQENVLRQRRPPKLRRRNRDHRLSRCPRRPKQGVGQRGSRHHSCCVEKRPGRPKHRGGNRHGITFQESAQISVDRNIVVDSQEFGIDSYAGSSNRSSTTESSGAAMPDLRSPTMAATSN